MPELVTTTTGLIVSGCTISLQLLEFIKHVRSAPGDISVLASELQDFCAVLQTLEDNLSVRRNQEWLNPKIRGVLDSTVEIFNRLEVLVQNHRIESGDRTIYRQWKKWKWTFHEKEIASLSNHLGTHKMTLNFIILLSLRSESTITADTVSRIECSVNNVLARLDGSENRENNTSRCLSRNSHVFSLPPPVYQAQKESKSAGVVEEVQYRTLGKDHVCKVALDEMYIKYTEDINWFVIHSNINKAEEEYLQMRTKQLRDYESRFQGTSYVGSGLTPGNGAYRWSSV